MRGLKSAAALASDPDEVAPDAVWPSATAAARPKIRRSARSCDERFARELVIAKRYELLSRLGVGGMGTVYRAIDRVLARTVAIKMLRQPVAGRRERQRFMREARSAAALNHPNIVTIHDFGSDQGQPFIVMELIDGSTLATVIETHQPIDVLRKLELLHDIGTGLEHAHERQVVHLDIKPSNVIVDSRHVPKILDFGIARVSGESEPTGLRGTPSHMAPEQITGRPDRRSDIFAMGILLYEVLCGRRAFPGTLNEGLLDRILNARYEPLPKDLLLQVPGIDAVIDRALAKEPADRYQTVGELNAAVDELRRTAMKAVATAGFTAGEKDAPHANAMREGGSSRATPVIGLGDLRARMLSARSSNELRRLKYEVDQYLSAHEHDVDARVLRDDIRRALLAEARPPVMVAESAPDGQIRRSSGSVSGNVRRATYVVITTLVVAAAVSGAIWTERRPRVPAQVAATVESPTPAATDIPMPIPPAAAATQTPDARRMTSSGMIDRPSMREGAPFSALTAPPSAFQSPAPSRRPNESAVDYTARVSRAEAAFADAKAKLGSGDFAAALTAFHSVERDQPAYPNLKLLIALTLRRQSQTVQNDLQAGLANEQAGKFREARLFYLHALRSDPSSAEAEHKAAAMKYRTSEQARRLLGRASAADKLGDVKRATALYEQARDLTMEGDAERAAAVTALDQLKR
jgi:serine/threonine protein kinase